MASKLTPLIQEVTEEELDKSAELSADNFSSAKHIRKCSGCKLPHDNHAWGELGPYCTGRAEMDEGKDYQDDEDALMDKLKQLKLKEEVLTKSTRLKQLKLAIAESSKRITELQQLQSSFKPSQDLHALGPFQPQFLPSSSQPEPGAGQMPSLPSQVNGIKQKVTHSASVCASFRADKSQAPHTPLDNLLAGYVTDAAPQALINNPDRALSTPQAEQESRMFLKPAQLTKGEQVLRIIDFVDKIVSTIKDRTLSDIGATKLVVSYGPKKPKLENVTIAQWVIANTRIFHTLFVII